MPISVFYIKQSDRKPYLRATLKDAAGVGIDLTGATVKFKMRRGFDQAVKVNTAADIISASSGIVEYKWAATDTDTVGEYDAEFEITYTGPLTQTVPNGGYFRVMILKKLG